MKFISSLVWIKQGLAKEVPEKVTLSKAELKSVLDDAKSGSKKKVPDEGDNEATTSRDKSEDEYDWENYDDDEVDSTAAGLSGLSVYSCNDDDPYMTAKDDEDESDIEDFHIQRDDNLIVAAQVEGTNGVLKFYLYNKNNDDFYVHHDIWLSSTPLCVEFLRIQEENLVAVGGVGSSIEVWDVDITEVLEPSFILGGETKKKKKATFKPEEATILDLAWNKNYEKVLASASTEKKVALWDLTSGEVVTNLSKFTDKVQSISWHPYESQHLLAGCCGGQASMLDCRSPDDVARKWELDGDVEKVIWNHFSPFYCLAATEKGVVNYYDIRSEKPIWSLSAHTKECTGLVLSSSCPNLLITSSMDEEMKVWDIADEPNFVYKHKAKLGKIFCLESCPDQPFVVCGGGDRKGNNLKVIDLMDYSAVQKRFENRPLVYSLNSAVKESVLNADEATSPKTKKRKI